VAHPSPPNPGETELVAAARSGDEQAFVELAEPHRHELHLHCYRMLGSLEEAEDVVQETFLRAWRGLASFERRSTFRAWLYRIATNACLDVLARRPRRVLPPQGPPADPAVELEPPVDLPWLQPYPDRLLDEIADDAAGPEARLVARETMELSFLAAIQHLPPRQRAVLILRDALGWSASETAALANTSVPAANSALQRARATLRARLPERRLEWARAADPSEEERSLLARYMDALERADLDGLVALLREDARITMPPLPAWFDGRAAVAEFHARQIFAELEWRHVPTRANGQPACGCYSRRPGEGRYAATSIDVLRIEDGRIAEITAFILPGLFPAFGLPPSL
jgi:RNA polymerase sigma-70 factor, ECF subfamily